MWFRSMLKSLARSARRRQKLALDGKQRARRLLLEGLEARRLMAFNVLAEYATGPNPTDLALAQIDSGSQLDLVVANTAAGQGSVRLGNADGTFNSSQSTGTASSSVATGDLTGDGVTDLASISTAAINATVILQAGNGNGTFQPPQNISLPPQAAPGNPDPTPLPQSPMSIATGDLNADGKLDLVVAGQTSFTVNGFDYVCGYYGCGYIPWSTTYTDGYVNVLMGTGSGGFAAPVVTSLGRGRSPSATAIGDLNSDGTADVLTANRYDLSALLGDGTGALAAPIHSGSGSALKSLSLGDIDGDSLLDSVTSHPGDYSLTVQKGQGNGSFSQLGYVPIGHPVDSAVVGDVNGDGTLDLVGVGTKFTCNSQGYYGCYDGDYSGQASVVLGNGAGGFSLPIASSLGTDFNGSFVDVALANLTADGLPELVTIESSTGLAIVAGNDGDWIAPVALSISSPTVMEGHSGTANAVFTITLESPSARDVTVDYATADLNANEEYWYGGPAATAGVDYTAAAGTLTIPAGQTSATISVPVIGDRIGESNELFFLNLSNPTYLILSNDRAVGTITDDEPFVSFEYNAFPEVIEGNTGTKSMTFTVELSAPSDVPVTVDFSTADGGALAGSDYQAATGAVTIVPGNTIQTFTVQVIGDTQAEYDEYFYVNLSNPANAKIGSGNRAGSILDDDAPPALFIGDASIVEGNSGTRSMTFTVNLSNPSGQAVSVNFATANSTAKTSDNDYLAASGRLDFAAGETTKTITVTIRGDTRKEANERFLVKLSGAVGATMADGQGEGTIANDDGGGKLNGKGNRSDSFASATDAAIDFWMASLRKKRGR